jgi:class 3 adenylate cyclase
VNIAQRIHDLPVLREATNIAYAVRKAAGDADGALQMLELYYTTRDSLSNDLNKQAVIEQRLQYDFEKKEALLKAEQDKKDALAVQELRRKKLQRDAVLGGFGLMVLLAGTFFFQRNRISKEKKRSEELLLNILPSEVAEELKAKGSAEAVHIDQVTVLFTDFMGFTAISETLSPQELVYDLNNCFSAFDRITEKYGIEKIKTIGDAYMAAGGLPTPNTTHATNVINAAFEMRDFIAEVKMQKMNAGLPYFEIRIGIHTGPVVAGIVGVKKFSYDIWGDTVNTASRMESSGEVGQINISQSTYELLKDTLDYTFESRGKIQAKGKGEMEMYFANRNSGNEI